MDQLNKLFKQAGQIAESNPSIMYLYENDIPGAFKLNKKFCTLYIVSLAYPIKFPHSNWDFIWKGSGILVRRKDETLINYNGTNIRGLSVIVPWDNLSVYEIALIGQDNDPIYIDSINYYDVQKFDNFKELADEINRLLNLFEQA